MVRPHAAWWAAILAVALVMAVGVYVTAVLDHLVERAVAGRRVTAGDILAWPVREAASLVLQQRMSTERPDRELWAFAPALLGGVAATALVVVPLSPHVAVADVAGGIVLFGAAMALDMVAVYLQGWSANSTLPLIAGYRFIAVALSYEMPVALVLIAVALPARSLAVGDIVRSQAHLWNVVRQPLGLPIYLVPALGMAFWGPLALPEAQDLAGGTSLEVSGAQLLVWRIAQLAVLVTVSAMGAAAFLGGWQGPGLPPAVWMVLKTLALLTLLVATRHVLGRVRLERFVVVAWAVFIPLALVDVLQGGLQALVAAR